jgi:hypothetical protein
LASSERFRSRLRSRFRSRSHSRIRGNGPPPAYTPKTLALPSAYFPNPNCQKAGGALGSRRAVQDNKAAPRSSRHGSGIATRAPPGRGPGKLIGTSMLSTGVRSPLGGRFVPPLRAVRQPRRGTGSGLRSRPPRRRRCWPEWKPRG